MCQASRMVSRRHLVSGLHHSWRNHDYVGDHGPAATASLVPRERYTNKLLSPPTGGNTALPPSKCAIIHISTPSPACPFTASNHISVI